MTVPAVCSWGVAGDDALVLPAPSTHCKDFRSNAAPASVSVTV